MNDIALRDQKLQMKADRNHRWRAILLKNNLDIDTACWWKKGEKDVELQLWKEVDVGYEKGKSYLKAELKKMSVEERKKYFGDLDLVEKDPDVWLAPSPA